MKVTESILAIVGSVFSFLAAKKVDAVVGKWLAYIVIAWEQRSSAEAKAEYAKAMADIKENVPEKRAAWDSWRERAAKPTAEIKPLV